MTIRSWSQTEQNPGWRKVNIHGPVIGIFIGVNIFGCNVTYSASGSLGLQKVRDALLGKYEQNLNDLDHLTGQKFILSTVHGTVHCTLHYTVCHCTVHCTAMNITVHCTSLSTTHYCTVHCAAFLHTGCVESLNSLTTLKYLPKSVSFR